MTAEPRTTDPFEAGGHLLQQVHFAPNTPVASEDLYAQVPRGTASRARDTMALKPHTLATTRTYFGRFPAAYFQRWTVVAEVTVRTTVSGTGRVQLHASDSQDVERLVATQAFSNATDEPVEFVVAIDKFLDGGFLWLDVESFDEPVQVGPVHYHSTGSRRSGRSSVVICTFNRPADCLATIRALSGELGSGKRVDRLYVVDQGTDLVRDQPGFEEFAASLSDRLVYIQQRNLGGAGGFTRGIFEALGTDERPENIVLLDDDVVLDPETLGRLVAFARHTIEPVIVGAHMLYLYHPNLLHSSGERALLHYLRAGMPVVDGESAIDLTEELPVKWVEPAYNAWWTCLIPSAVVDKIGYPLPVFFQWDDIEYGLRAGAHKIPTVTLPGAAVWHADFSFKDPDDWSRYFSHRNSLITSALHSNHVPRAVTTTLTKEVIRFILSMQYARAAMQLTAIEDFLRGPAGLADGGAERASWVRTMRKDFPDTVRHAPAEIVDLGLFSVPARRASPPPRRVLVVFLQRFLRQVTGRNKHAGKISAGDNVWWHASLFKSVVVSDAAQDAFRIRTLTLADSWAASRRAAKVLLRLRLNGGRAAQQWRRALPKLTSRANWERLFHADS